MKIKIKENFNKNKKPLIVLSIIWLIFSCVSIKAYKINLGKESFGNKRQDALIELNKDTVISLVMDTVDNADAISLCLTNYARLNHGELYIEIMGNESGTKYADIKTDVSKIDPDRFNSLALNTPLNQGKDKTVTITIASNCDGNNSLGLFYGNNTEEITGTYLLNSSNKDGLLAVRMMTANRELSVFAYTLIALISFAGLAVIFMIFLFEPNKETIFATIILLFGLIMIVVITPLSGADEDYHYKQTLRLSNQLMGKEVSLIEDRYLSTFGFESMFNTGSGYKTILEIYDDEMDLVNRNMYTLKKAPVYTYNLVYLPAAIGVTVARLFPLNYLWTCYLGRLCNLLFYVTCIYFAIKKTPVLKTAFGVVASSVMLLQMSFVFGQDGWICCLSMLLLAHFLNWMFGKEKIATKDYLIALAIDFLLAPAKTVYSLFVLLFWFVPADRFENQKHRNILLAIMMIPMVKEVGSNVMQRISGLLFNTIHAETIMTRSVVTPMVFKQPFGVSYIATHVNETIAIIIRTIKSGATTWIYGMFGRYLSGLSLTLPLSTSRITMLVALLASLIYEKNNLSLPAKFVTLMICVAISGLVIIMMLVGWTTTEDYTIQGIQGRYFTPFAIYLLCLPSNNRISIPKKMDKYIITLQLFVIASTLFYVMSYTFVNF